MDRVQDTLKASEKAIHKYRVRPTTPVSYQIARRIPLSLGAMLGLALIDIGGFYNGVNMLTDDNIIVKLIIIAAFTVGFEIAPGFLGYGMDLWIYKVSKKNLYKYIIIFSSVSFGIGFIANCFLRIQGYLDLLNSKKDKIGICFIITMILLPLVTSFISLVIGLLSFDPLVMKLIRLYERRAKLSTHKIQLEGKLKVYELSTEGEKIKERINDIVEKAEERKKYLNDIEKELGKYAISLVYKDEYIDI
ncbi:MAG: hypothetical protein IJM37_10320 [Lachnospiraceae bacterium]|nr:hypothetical protein [Lachnospiraceae bacterium]